MKAYWKDLRLKELAAVDRGMARQGVAYTREAHRGGHPGCALSSVKLEDVAGGFRTAATNHRINTHQDRCQTSDAASCKIPIVGSRFLTASGSVGVDTTCVPSHENSDTG
jgi:hypothetical protein